MSFSRLQIGMPKSLLKRLIRRCGFDLRRFSPEASDEARLVKMLRTHDVGLIFDVGANKGQFGTQLRDAGYSGRIVSFEPLSSARETLVAVSGRDPLWEVASQAAIGSEDREAVEINVAANSESSSILKMLRSHATAAPESIYVDSESVPLRRLDALGQSYLRPDSNLFIKIDTQGYEDQVLLGAPDLLSRSVGIQMELSTVPLYEGQRLYDEMLRDLRSLGFELWGLSPTFVDPASGRLLQFDGTFFRPSASGRQE